jgi:DNA repair exonuclease SbcCD ATPase subunit
MIKSILRGVLDYTNDIEEYKKITQSLSDIENKFHALSSQEDFINMITTDIAKLEYQIAEDNNTIEKLNTDLTTLDKEFTRITGIISTYTSILEYNKIINECMEAIKILNDEIEENKANIDRIQKINSDIEKLTVNLSELKSQLKPIKEKRDSLAYKLNVSIEYDKELKQYSTMYEKIDTLKYFCSPTTGIQLLFANMYLSKILEKANRILSGLFGGVFALLPLVVTENEFRIPVAVNGGINHDDITSMSSAQVSLISMIISIALLSQTSTKLNIIVGDEIDAPFDSENRREFINILYQLMGLVNASQCVLISHNSEISTSDCDVILLKSSDPFNEGNIIWSYK